MTKTSHNVNRKAEILVAATLNAFRIIEKRRKAPQSAWGQRGFVSGHFSWNGKKGIHLSISISPRATFPLK